MNLVHTLWVDTTTGITHYNMKSKVTTFVRDLSPQRYYNAAFSDGRGTAYIFGNPRGETWGYHAVEKLDMYSLESTFGPENFPAIREQKAAAVWDGRYAYVIGAFANSSAGIESNGIFQFDPETMENEFVPVINFPGDGGQMYTSMSAVYVGKLNRIYMIGGRTTNYGTDTVEILDKIFYIDLPSLPTKFPTSSATTDTPTSVSTVTTSITTTESVPNPTTDAINDDLEAVLVSTKLPRAMAEASSYYDGEDSIYIFGGSTGTTIQADILRYSISNDTIEKVASLPRASYRGTVAGDKDGNMYYITGYRANGEMETLVWRYATFNGSVSTFSYTDRNYDCDTVSVNETSSYTFGGFYFASRILHFNMETRETSVVGNLSRTRYYQTAFSDDNGNAYIFGNGASQDWYHTVEKLNMHTLESSLGPEDFPAILSNKAASVWTGRYGFLVGRFGNATRNDGILRFHPTTMTHIFVPVKNFPGQPDLPFTSTSLVYVPKLDRIYMIGGMTLIPFNNTHHDSIWYIPLSSTEVPTSSTSPAPIDFNCSPQIDGRFPDPADCRAFYSCLGGIPTHRFCPEGQVYHAECDFCDDPNFVDCGNRPIP